MLPSRGDDGAVRALDWLVCYEGWRATGAWAGRSTRQSRIYRMRCLMVYVPPRRSEGTIQVRRPQQPWPKDRQFRILSIDGGGAAHCLPASVLAELDTVPWEPSPSQFISTIAGTSTGGIIALGLAHGLTAAEIRDIYVTRGGDIFRPPPASGASPAYSGGDTAMCTSESRSRTCSWRYVGDAPLGNAKTRLCIPSLRAGTASPGSSKHPPPSPLPEGPGRADGEGRPVDGRGSDLFEALLNNGYVMVDGGLWANNPVMNALVDVLACFDTDPDPSAHLQPRVW